MLNSIIISKRKIVFVELGCPNSCLIYSHFGLFKKILSRFREIKLTFAHCKYSSIRTLTSFIVVKIPNN